jgi:hypothetical protein
MAPAFDGGLIALDGPADRRPGRPMQLLEQAGEAHRSAAQFNQVLSGGPSEPLGEAPLSPGPPDKTGFVYAGFDPAKRQPSREISARARITVASPQYGR